MQAPIRRQFKTNVHETAKTPLAKVESITPELIFQSRVATTTPIVTEQPHLKQTDTTPDVKVNVSTALNELREVENSLSKLEAAGPTVGSSLGSKRSGGPSVQRRPIPATIDVAGTTVDDDAVPTQIGDIQGNETAVPYVRFSKVMEKLASEIIATSGGGPVDVVFVVDASDSMGDNIKGVYEHLAEMIDVYKSSDIDYTLGLTHFSARTKKNSRKLVNFIEVFQLTKKLSVYKRDIRAIVPRGDEFALDAIAQTVDEMKFRATSKKHLILVTDEPFGSLEGLTVQDSIALCREFGIYVNVLGLPNKQHQLLASETNGKWHAIPEDPKKRQGRQFSSLPTRAKHNFLRKTQWGSVQAIKQILLPKNGNTPVDIVLFIDASKSMEDKLPQFMKQLDFLVRDWDNALIDYQIGVVRFQTRASVNIVNVFNPPQTLDQIHKIAELPCQEDENLLHAVTEGLRQIKLRPGAQTHLILVTDEPINKNVPTSGVIQFLEEKHAVVSVVGTFDDFLHHVTIKTGGVWVTMPGGLLNYHVNW
ncbi:MAG: VWA domain-containing protein [Candidatus Poribacteria bacterium]|nr:VWA domain-containing protein [Candidatus Poribacteria bacterium]